jgi:AraC-like DNA-binding protein
MLSATAIGRSNLADLPDRLNHPIRALGQAARLHNMVRSGQPVGPLGLRPFRNLLGVKTIRRRRRAADAVWLVRPLPPRAPDMRMGEPGTGRLVGAVRILQIHQHGALHHLLQPREVERAELLPFGHDHQCISAFGRSVGAQLVDRTITARALDVGFADLTYFNRAFRRRFGVSPYDVRTDAAR